MGLIQRHLTQMVFVVAYKIMWCCTCCILINAYHGAALAKSSLCLHATDMHSFVASPLNWLHTQRHGRLGEGVSGTNVGPVSPRNAPLNVTYFLVCIYKEIHSKGYLGNVHAQSALVIDYCRQSCDFYPCVHCRLHG